MKTIDRITALLPFVPEARALACCRRLRGQGSLEYIMMLSAVSIVIVIALAMIAQLKGSAIHAFSNGTNQSITSELSRELANLTSSG
jgi:hypothetical protein